jgi:hypothetical protein
MIDYIKAMSLKTDSCITHNEILADRWESKSKSGGELINELTKYKSLRIFHKNGVTKFSGSIHKYFNGGVHNHNDFTFTNICDVLNELITDFKINPKTSVLNNVEFGVNVIVPFNVDELLNRLIAYRGQPFNRDKEKGKSYYQCELSEYILKIYNKGLQYNQPENILRFEIKVIRMRYLRSKGVEIYNLQDLQNHGIYEPLGSLLSSTFNDILFDEPTINQDELSHSERDFYLKGNNPRYWTKGEKLSAAERKQKERVRRRFIDLLDNHRKGVDMPTVIAELIKSKWVELSQNHRIVKQPEKVANVTTSYFNYKDTIRHYDSLIRKQRKDSKFLSAKTIKERSGLAEELSNDRRRNERRCSHDESYYVAHNLRNDESNPRNNLRLRIEKSLCRYSGGLFGMSEIRKTLVLSNQERQLLDFWKGTEYEIRI